MTRLELVSQLGQGAVVHELKPPFFHSQGFKWGQRLAPELAAEPPDSEKYPTGSPLLLFEGETLMGPRHAADVDVVDIGKGAYVHWADHIFFSASDNSDPNTNGRSYSLMVAPPRANILAFGSCHVDMMLRAECGRRLVNQVHIGAITHNTREMIQLVRASRRQIDLPPELLPYIVPKCGLNILQAPHLFETVDGMLLEICNPDEIIFQGVYLNRNLIGEQMIQPLQSILDEAGGRVVNDWFSNGLRLGNFLLLIR